MPLRRCLSIVNGENPRECGMSSRNSYPNPYMSPYAKSEFDKRNGKVVIAGYMFWIVPPKFDSYGNKLDPTWEDMEEYINSLHPYAQEGIWDWIMGNQRRLNPTMSDRWDDFLNQCEDNMDYLSRKAEDVIRQPSNRREF